MVIELDKSVKLKSFQKEMLKKANDFSKRNLVVCCARQTGKSFTLRLIALKWMIEHEGCTVGYFSLTNKMCKYFFTLVAKILPKQIIQSCNASDLTITLTNGSMMRFYTLEPTAISHVRGTTLDFCIVDEAAFMAVKTPDGQLIWEEIISPMCDARCRKVVFVSTPHGKQGVFYSFVLKCYTQKKSFDFIKCQITDDETKTPEWLEAKKAEMSDNSWRQEYMVEFLDEGVGFFTHYTNKFTLTEELKGRVCFGIDWSSVGEDNTILTAMDYDGRTKQWLIEGSFDEKYSRIGSIIDSYSDVSVIYAEINSIGSVMINELKKKTKHKSKIKGFTTTNSSKNEIIQALARDIEQNELVFEANNELLKSELGTYSYEISKSGNVIFNGIAGTHDDTVMSLAICNYGRNKTKSTGPKIMFL